MKLHHSVVDKVIMLVANYSGHRDESKLRAELAKLDFMSYQQKTGDQNTILVLTEQFVDKVQKR